MSGTPNTNETYQETVLRFRVYRIELPRVEGDLLGKFLYASFSDLNDAWETVLAENNRNHESGFAKYQHYMVEDFGSVEVRDVPVPSFL